MIPLPTASSLERAQRCPASVVLPQVRERSGKPAERGVSIHRYLELVADVYGPDGPQHADAVEAALSEVPEEFRTVCSAIHLPALRITPGHGWSSEVALAWDYETGDGRILGKGNGRDYAGRKPSEYVGTVDRMLSESDRVTVTDYKSGHGYQPEAKRHPQLRFHALAACRALGKSAATVELIRIGEDGAVDIDSAELDALDLDATAAELRELTVRIRQVGEVVDAGKRPDLYEGRWCTFCPAFESCPAKIGLISEFLGSSGEMLNGLELPIAYRRIRDLEALARRGLERIKDIIEDAGAPLQIGEGRFYGPTQRGFREHS